MAIESRTEGEFSTSRFEAVTQDRTHLATAGLAGALLVAFVVRLVLAHQIVTPWIMVDELIYSELAKSFAQSGDFLLRGLPSGFNAVAYPIAISPGWLADSVDTAYDIARAINVLLMVSAAVPVYLWGRRLMPAGYALLASVLVLVMPSLSYSGMLMTENAFFPAFVLASFAIGVTLERPTLVRQALALAAIALTCTVRFQGLALLAIYALALVVKVVLDLRAPAADRRLALRQVLRFWPSALAIAVGAAAYLAYKAGTGADVATGLGAYGGVVKVHYDASNAFSWTLDHFAELGFSVAIVPASALIVLLGLAVRGRPTTPAERAFLAVCASAAVLLVVEVGVYASRFALRIEERNMFCVAPLLFLALCLWLAKGMPRPLLLTAVAAAAPVLLLLTLDLKGLLDTRILSDTFGLIPLLRLDDGLSLDTVRRLMLAGGVVAALAFALLPRRVAGFLLPFGVGLFLVLSSYAVQGAIRDHSRATFGLTDPANPSWIDEKIGPSSDAAYVYGSTGDPVGEAQALWQTEFWNRSVGPILRVGPPEPAALPEASTTFDAATGRFSVAGAMPTSALRYAVAPTTVQLDGRLLARSGKLSLYRIDGPLRLKALTGGVYADGWMANDASFTHYTRSPRRSAIRVRLSRASWSGPSRPAAVNVTIGPLTAAAGQPALGRITESRSWTLRGQATRQVLLDTPREPYRIEIHVGSTFSPSDYGVPDPRRLGAQLDLRPVSTSP